MLASRYSLLQGDRDMARPKAALVLTDIEP
jgi:hypothetical protein